MRMCLCGMQELKDYLNRVGEVTFADAHKEHLNEGLAVSLSVDLLHSFSLYDLVFSLPSQELGLGGNVYEMSCCVWSGM